MTANQYNNVAQWTLANGAAEAATSADAARAIFTNMGVPFPSGSCSEILLTLMTDDYMGWKACTYAQAREFANAGVAAVGVTPYRVVVVLPDDADNSIALANEMSDATYAVQSENISTSERMDMQFFALYAASTTTTVEPTTESSAAKVKSNQLFSQGNTLSFPSESGYTGQAFYSTDFIKKVCEKTGASANATIQKYGCAVCALGMFILYKGGVTNTDSNVYYAVKEATTKSTNINFDYYRATFTANVGDKSIVVRQETTNIIPTDKNLAAVKDALLSGKCVMLCLQTSTSTHFVLADELIGDSEADYLDRIKVADPANGQRKTLRQAIERTISSASASHVLTGYCVS